MPNPLSSFCHKRAKPAGSDEMAKLDTKNVRQRYAFHWFLLTEIFCTSHKLQKSASTQSLQITAPLQPQTSFSKIRLWLKRRNGFWASALEASDNTPTYQALIREEARNPWTGLTPLTFPHNIWKWEDSGHFRRSLEERWVGLSSVPHTFIKPGPNARRAGNWGGIRNVREASRPSASGARIAPEYQHPGHHIRHLMCTLYSLYMLQHWPSNNTGIITIVVSHA